MSREIGFEIRLQHPYEDALKLTETALMDEGFGILTSIDVQETLKKKLDVDFRPYIILGACNPPLAHRALSNNANAGLLLPCNVTLEAETHDSSIVRIADPEVVLAVSSLAEDTEIRSVASEARQKLERVAEALRNS